MEKAESFVPSIGIGAYALPSVLNQTTIGRSHFHNFTYVFATKLTFCRTQECCIFVGFAVSVPCFPSPWKGSWLALVNVAFSSLELCSAPHRRTSVLGKLRYGEFMTC